MAVEITHPLPSVTKGSQTSVGGCQQWSADPIIRDVGCGIIAAQDLLIHLALYHPYPQGLLQGINPSISCEAYDTISRYLKRFYFPLIPHSGINGVFLAIGLNRYFRKYHISLHAAWRSSAKTVFSDIEEMLANDHPVILSIGPNFPFFWKKEKMALYSQQSANTISCKTNAHYVSVVGLDDQWITVSSWGTLYHISRNEYMRYMQNSSIPLVNNLIRIQKTKSK